MVPMGGMSYLQTMNHVIKRGYLWMGCPENKQQITRLKEGTYGWNVLLTNDESRSLKRFLWMGCPVCQQ